MSTMLTYYFLFPNCHSRRDFILMVAITSDQTSNGT